MADPRLASTNRVGTEPRHAYTYAVDGADIAYDATQPNGSAVVGRAVMLSANGTVRLTADASPVLGQLVKVEPDGRCAVLEIGVCQLPSSGTITAGTRIVGALGPSSARGYVRSVVAATLADVAAGRHTVLDAADTANVEVALGR